MSKRLLLSLSLALLLSNVATAATVNLTTLFGSPKATPGPTPQACQLTASKNPITADGVDTAVVTLADASGAAISTGVFIQVEGGGGMRTFPNVTFPKTVSATSAGQWKVDVIQPGFACTLTITAQ